MNKMVHIVGGDLSIARMYMGRGWSLTQSPYEADLIQFTGGEDVDPALYGEEKHATTGSNPRRDAWESSIFHSLKDEKFIVGICRGAQFTNVMCGGRMWQDVDRHAIWGTHRATLEDGSEWEVTSTHHQMMRPSEDAVVLLTASLSSYRDTATERNTDEGFLDIESVLYPGVLCFQPHPEYVERDHPCQDLFFKLLEENMG
jgi:gamma-glutamyl-gamma-aminobutyrate hydrolase PuuD